MRYSGRLTSWKDDQGFGFVTPNVGGERVFIHIKAFHRDASRPSEGDLLSYELEFDERKRPRGRNVQRVGERLQRPTEGRGWKVPAFTLAFCLFLLLSALTSRLPWPIIFVYLVLSGIAYVAYGADKGAAKAGNRRTPENTLHLLALLGGWPGALMAQRCFRHKSVKTAFQTVFWVTVMLNCISLSWLLSGSGRAFLGALGG